jgi:hypothetical protein
MVAFAVKMCEGNPLGPGADVDSTTPGGCAVCPLARVVCLRQVSPAAAAPLAKGKVVPSPPIRCVGRRDHCGTKFNINDYYRQVSPAAAAAKPAAKPVAKPAPKPVAEEDDDDDVRRS